VQWWLLSIPPASSPAHLSGHNPQSPLRHPIAIIITDSKSLTAPSPTSPSRRFGQHKRISLATYLIFRTQTSSINLSKSRQQQQFGGQSSRYGQSPGQGAGRRGRPNQPQQGYGDSDQYDQAANDPYGQAAGDDQYGQAADDEQYGPDGGEEQHGDGEEGPPDEEQDGLGNQGQDGQGANSLRIPTTPN